MKTNTYKFLFSCCKRVKEELSYTLLIIIGIFVFLGYSMGVMKYLLFMSMLAIFASVVFLMADLALVYIGESNLGRGIYLYLFVFLMIHLLFIQWLGDIKFYGYLVCAGLLIGGGVFLGLRKK